MRSSGKRSVCWIITLATAIFIFYMSSKTFPSGGGTGFLSYVYHFGVFFILALFLLLASSQKRFNKEVFMLAIVIAIIYGALDELHQYFVPGRYCDYKDMLLDAAGTLFAGVVYVGSLIVRRKIDKKIKR